jgi:HK97 family phage prohead protease
MTMALQGYATRYNQILPLHHGTHKLVLPGAFDRTLNSDATVEFRLNHHDGECLGSTADNLELFSDVKGLAFRMRFPDSALGRDSRVTAEARVNTGMSIGFNYNGAHKEHRSIDGLDVVVIIEAWLYEITWLHLVTGAVKDAFASYENIDDSSLREDCRSGKMLGDGAAVGVTRSIRQLMHLLECESWNAITHQR